MRLPIGQFATLILFAFFLAPYSHADVQSEAKEILSESGINAGFIVHWGIRDGELTAALRQHEAIQVHGLITNGQPVKKIRQTLKSKSVYGPVSIDDFSGSTVLPYNDNLVNLFVAESLDQIPMQEVMRVLVPNGVAMIKKDGIWQRTVKPRPDNIDEWSHYLHDPTGNSVANDDVVAPPRHLQWVGSPRWSRHHDRMASMSALVSTNGRMFYVMDEGSRISIQLPPKWKLIARDAFNGSILWKRDIGDWQNHLWPLKSGPTQLARRLVSTDDEVFVTLGYNAPLVALDAASGETLREYEGSDATEEIIHTNEKLFLVVRKDEAELQNYAPLHGRVGDQARVRSFFWNEEPRVLMAFDAKSGKQLWSKQTVISPLTLAAKEGQIYFHDGQKLVSLNQSTGEIAWESASVTRRQSFTFNFGPRLVIHDDVVLYAGGDGKIASLDAKSGEELWNAKFPSSGYQSPQDLMVMDGLVWLAPLTSGKDSGVYTGRDPRTGEVKKEFPPDIDTYWFHHRCYIAKGTKNFLMPSRTGIEFVDPDQEHWDIHHWVRGGCLYGVMPCNGLTYAPPHNCACYPEAKLFGFNALAPTAPTRPIPKTVPEAGRLQKGPAYSAALAPRIADADRDDWPTYRRDQKRSAAMIRPIEGKLSSDWKTQLGGRLTPPVVSGGQVYVAQTDQHTLHCLGETDGEPQWSFVAGARIDSPPTIYRGRVVFGCADGYVYCLDTDGTLCWRYRAAPLDRRTMAYEQLESLWPVHGSVLVRNDIVHCVAGRSNFLDGGLRLYRLDLASGEKLSETIMDETNPETGNNLQEKLEILQMPVGLPDILSCDGRHLFMKSQKFDLEGNRLEIGPNSGDFAKQASKQRGEDAHIFAPMGFLDDSWFHRSYWVLGQSFAGGHGGYFQAGRFAPSGRLLVQGNGYVYGYGRKPEYLRWTTTLEHQLFAAEQNPPEIPARQSRRNAGVSGSYAQFPMTKSLNPTNKAITLEAWVTSTKPTGVVVARGGPQQGFALILANGRPRFLVRANEKLTAVEGPQRIVGGWHHLVGVLNEDKSMSLYVDGELAATGKANSLLGRDPAQPMEVGLDGGSSVGEYPSPYPLTGMVDEVRLYFSAATADQIKQRYADGTEISADAVLAASFDDGTARDHSLKRNDGTVNGAKIADGKFGKALQFSGKGKKRGGNGQSGNSLVKPKWTQDIPIYVRAMILSGNRLMIAGPPDIIDEESTFQGLTESDPEVQKLLTKQDLELNGDGGRLLTINIDTGETEQDIALGTLPVWDAMAGANRGLFLTTVDGASSDSKPNRPLMPLSKDKAPSLPRYDLGRSYSWNYERAPEPVERQVPDVPGKWEFCGLKVDSPLGISAGPLLNGRWCRYYASLGFDVLTYKTVRSAQRDCYPEPNLVHVPDTQINGVQTLDTTFQRSKTWAVAFGMPSASPNHWREDVEQTRRMLPDSQVLVVSVVGTMQDGWSIQELADDYATCARWAADSGADCVEANFSCPNVVTCDGQLFQDPDQSALVAKTIKQSIPSVPLIIKIGHQPSHNSLDKLYVALAPHCEAIATTNSIACTVRDHQKLMFGGLPRGICGEAILDESIAQTARGSDVIAKNQLDLLSIGVGGISHADHIHRYLQAGAHACHLATAVMQDPSVGIRIRKQMAGWDHKDT